MKYFIIFCCTQAKEKARAGRRAHTQLQTRNNEKQQTPPFMKVILSVYFSKYLFLFWIYLFFIIIVFLFFFVLITKHTRCIRKKNTLTKQCWQYFQISNISCCFGLSICFITFASTIVFCKELSLAKLLFMNTTYLRIFLFCLFSGKRKHHVEI